ncbi:MAG: hypothetical protein GY765_06260 [bacterium]|nr:hypothetical protein [bacterium]
MKKESVPRLDLAPKLKRTLSLWNPLDYLRLLYWGFFFPQAIPWYVKSFGKPEYQHISGENAILEVFRYDPVQRRLMIQGFIILIITTPYLALGMSSLGAPVLWVGVVFGVGSVVVMDVDGVGNMFVLPAN